MFGIGMTELMVIFVIALLVLGPKKLPEVARSLGKSLAEFRRASTDLRREFLSAADDLHEPPPPRPPAAPAAPPPGQGSSPAAEPGPAASGGESSGG